MPEKHSIGLPLPRFDAEEKVRGTAVFGADINLPGQLVAKFLPAPLAHAEIISIDISRAAALPGVLAVLTGQELPTPASFDPQLRMFAYMARHYVVFQGQPVAAVAAIDLSTAERALELIAVEYRLLPVVVTLQQAILPECLPISREQVSGAPEPQQAGQSSNIAQAITYAYGDLEAGFQEADLVLEHTYSVPVVHQSYIEPHTVTAFWDHPGHLSLWEPVQGAFAARTLASRTLGIPQSKVTINTTEIGGGFGGKIDGLYAPIAALLAKKARRPVQLVLTRHEELLAADPAPHSIIRLKTGVRRDGSLTAIEGEILVDAGAFTSGWIMGSLTSSLRNSYRFPAWRLAGQEVLTNKAPIGSYRSPGAPNGAFAMESQMDEMARQLGIDPLAFRLHNLVREGDLLTNAEPQVRTGAREVLEALVGAGAWNGKPLPERAGSDGLLHGRGLALGGWDGGNGPASAIALLDADGCYRFILGQVDLSGSFTSLAQIAAQVLEVNPERVVITKVNTDAAPFAPESSGSQTVIAMGAAVQMAAQKLKEKILQNVAAILEVGVDQLVIDDEGIAVAGKPAQRLSYASIYQSETEGSATSGPLVEVASAGLRKPAPGYAATLAEVAIDPQTGRVYLTRLVIAQDVGCAINRLAVEGQIQGAAIQSAGMALWEEVQYDAQGLVRNPGLLDYRLATAMDVPRIESLIVEVPSGDGPYGSKVVGETPMVSPVAAIANAVADALGVRIYDLPITPERVWQARRPLF